MSTEAVFSAAYREAGGLGGLEMVPTWLSVACVAAVPVTAAGISVYSTAFQVPIGASTVAAATAERLQFTVGQGPCLSAHATGQMVLARETDLAERWPEYHEQLTAATPFRAVACVPLPGALGGVGALDLYLQRPDQSAELPLADVRTVAELVADCLAAQPWVPTPAGSAEPAWLGSPPARDRYLVSVAMGMLSVATGVGFADALEMLRMHAYTTDHTVDQTAADLVSRHLSIKDLDPTSNI